MSQDFALKITEADARFRQVGQAFVERLGDLAREGRLDVGVANELAEHLQRLLAAYGQVQQAGTAARVTRQESWLKIADQAAKHQEESKKAIEVFDEFVRNAGGPIARKGVETLETKIKKMFDAARAGAGQAQDAVAGFNMAAGKLTGPIDPGIRDLKAGFDDLAKTSAGPLGVLESFRLKAQDLAGLMKSAGAGEPVLSAFATGDLRQAENAVASIAAAIADVKKQQDALFDAAAAAGQLPPFEEAWGMQKMHNGLVRSAVVAKEAMDLLKKLGKERDEALGGKRAGVLAGNRSAFEKLSSEAADLTAMLDQGVLSWADYAKAVARVTEEFDKASKASEIRLPQAFLEGSAETVSLLNRMNAAQPRGPAGVQQAGDAAAALAPLLEQAARAGSKNNDQNDRIIAILRDIARNNGIKVAPMAP